MERLIFYSYPKCSTCSKASKWLEEKDINYKFIDIVKNPPSKELLKMAIKQFSTNIKKIFNSKGKSYKAKEKDIVNLFHEEFIDARSKDGKLIKRPILIINERKFIFGFNESEYRWKLF